MNPISGVKNNVSVFHLLEHYQERVKNGEIPSWIDPDKFKILKRTVVEIAGDWKEAKREKDN